MSPQVNGPDYGHETETATLTSVVGDLGPLADKVAELARAAETDRPKLDEHWQVPDGVLAQVLRPGDDLVVKDLELLRDEPRRERGTYVVHDAASLVTLVRRLGHAQTTLWAQQRTTGAARPSITAVLNDAVPHAEWSPAPPKAEDGERARVSPPSFTPGGPGWGDHRVTLEVRVDPDWKAWADRDANVVKGAEMDKVTLAEFLTDQLHNIAEPPAVDLIRAITTFETKRNITVSQVIQLDTGEQQLIYIEKDDEHAGTVTLPRELTVNLRPFYGASIVALKVALRYRLDHRAGLIVFRLHRIRPDLAEDAAWADVCAQVAGGLPEWPLLQGPAPEPVRPAGR